MLEFLDYPRKKTWETLGIPEDAGGSLNLLLKMILDPVNLIPGASLGKALKLGKLAKQAPKIGKSSQLSRILREAQYTPSKTTGKLDITLFDRLKNMGLAERGRITTVGSPELTSKVRPLVFGDIIGKLTKKGRRTNPVSLYRKPTGKMKIEEKFLPGTRDARTALHNYKELRRLTLDRATSGSQGSIDNMIIDRAKDVKNDLISANYELKKKGYFKLKKTSTGYQITNYPELVKLRDAREELAIPTRKFLGPYNYPDYEKPLMEYLLYQTLQSVNR